MVARWQWLLTQSTKRLWFRASLFSLLGVVTALMAMILKDYVPITLSAKIGADAVDKILGIIASSMLAVTTFSLSTMVAAYSAASSSVTPRATTLLMEDSTTQNALATFIGSFLFSLVGIIALSTGAYGSQGRVVLFAVTLVVVILIVYTLLRWIDHLSRLGRVGETIDRVEAATLKAVRDRAERPAWAPVPTRPGWPGPIRRSLAARRLAMCNTSTCRRWKGWPTHTACRFSWRSCPATSCMKAPRSHSSRFRSPLQRSRLIGSSRPSWRR